MTTMALTFACTCCRGRAVCAGMPSSMPLEFHDRPTGGRCECRQAQMVIVFLPEGWVDER